MEGSSLREKRDLDAGEEMRAWSSANVTWRAERLGRSSFEIVRYVGLRVW
jgi:hypothetical protein